MRVHVRDAKGNRDRLVPLPQATLDVLRRFWAVHRNPELLFPSRAGGAAGAHCAQVRLDRGGVQRALHQVVQDMGKRSANPLPRALARGGQMRYAAMAISVGAGVAGAIGVTDTPRGRQLWGSSCARSRCLSVGSRSKTSLR